MTKAMEGVAVLVGKYLGLEQLKVESYSLVSCENLSLGWVGQHAVDAILNVAKMALDWLLSVAREMLAGSEFEIPDARAAHLPDGETLAHPAAELSALLAVATCRFNLSEQFFTYA